MLTLLINVHRHHIRPDDPDNMVETVAVQNWNLEEIIIYTSFIHFYKQD